MPPRLRCLLYRAIHRLPDSRYAGRQASRAKMRSARRKQSLQTIRSTRKTRCLRGFCRQCGELWRQYRTGNQDTGCIGTGDPTGNKWPNRVALNEAKPHFGDMLLKAQRAPVQINKNGKPVVVVISAEEYENIERSSCVFCNQESCRSMLI